MLEREKLLRWIDESYSIAKSHGFHERGLSVEHMVMLIVGEIGEAVEADRKGKRANVGMYEKESVTSQPSDRVLEHKKFCFESFVKDTVEDELADVAIRIFDTCGALRVVPRLEFRNLDFGAYMNNRSFCESCFVLTHMLCHAEGVILSDDGTMENVPSVFGMSLCFLFALCEKYGIDLERHIELKSWYNANRPYKNGKRY